MKTIEHSGLVGDFAWKLPDHVSGKVDEKRIADVIEDFLLVLLKAGLRSEVLDSVEHEVASLRVVRPVKISNDVDMSLEVSMTSRKVYIGGVDADLTPREFAIISTIFGKGRHVPLDEVIRSVYGDVEINGKSQNLIQAHLKNFRGKAAKLNPDFDYIECSVGIGYMIVQPD